jgi:hypothetical protein
MADAGEAGAALTVVTFGTAVPTTDGRTSIPQRFANEDFSFRADS